MAGEAVGARETLARLTLELGADGTKLSPEMQGALAKAQSQLDAANKKMEASHTAMVKAVQSKIDSINADRATQQMRVLEQAVSKMGGAAALNSDQVKRLRTELDSLAAAGAKVPSALAGMQSNKLGEITTALGTGDIKGLIGSIGPAGIAATAVVGSVTEATKELLRTWVEMTAEAERWVNTSKKTGLGVREVQQLGTLLEDAQIPAEALDTSMKKMAVEIESGGKKLQAFGVDVNALKDLSPEEQMRSLAASIMAVSDPTMQAAMAVAAFGKNGTALLPVMAQIADGSYKMFHAFDDAQVAQLKRADDALDQLSRTWKVVKGEFAIGLTSTMGGGPFSGLGSWIAQKAYDTGILGEAGRQKGLPPLRAPAVDTTPLSMGTPSPEAQAALEKAKEAQKLADEAAKEALAERKAMAVQMFREQVTNTSELAGWEQKLLDIGVKRSEVERLIYDKRKQLMAEDAREMMRIANARESNVNESGKALDEWIKQTTPTEDNDAAHRLDDAKRAAGEFAASLRNADEPAARIAKELEAMGFSAEEARKIIAMFAPSFEQMAEDGAAAGDSIETITENLKKAGANSSQVARGLHAIGVETFSWSKSLGQVGSVISSFGGLWNGVGAAVGNAGSAIDNFADAKMKRAQGNVAAAAVATKKAWQDVAQAGIAAIGALGQALGGYQTKAGGTLSGAAQGAQAGSAFGGWGMLIGGLLGAAAGGYFGGENENKNGIAEVKDTWARLKDYVKQNPLFTGNEMDPLQKQLDDMDAELKRMMADAKAQAAAQPQADWKKSLLLGFSVGGSLKESLASIIGGPLAHIWGGGRSEADILGDQMKQSKMFDWDKMFAQAAEWGLDLQKAYKEGGSALNDALKKYLDLADNAQKLQQQEAELQAQKRKDLEDGLTSAAQGAKAMREAMDELGSGLSEAGKKAAEQLIAKVKAALLAAGMGYQLDPKLEKSAKYQAAQGLAQGAAQLIAGSRQAGIIDTGMMAAGGNVAQAAKDAAYDAAIKAGKTEAEAQKAGLGAVSGLLREQLNASIQSGQALDANTQRLLEEAKKNGINIVADPLVQQIDLQKKMLDKLGIIAANSGGGGGGGGGGETPNPENPTVPANTPEDRKPPPGVPYASGIYRGSGSLLETVTTKEHTAHIHDGEQMAVLPKGMADGGAVIVPKHLMKGYARGLYADTRLLNTGVNGSGRGPLGGGGGPAQTTIVHVEVPPHNPLQSAQEARQMRDHSIKSVMQHTRRALAPLVASRRA